MKLYYAPGACSMADHICLREAGLDFELVKVDIRAGKTEHGDDFRAVNPLGYVPVLELNDGHTLTENAAILQYIGDRVPDTHLSAPGGTMAHYKQIEWLGFISTELHKTIGALFKPGADAAVREAVMARMTPRLEHVNRALEHKEYMAGHVFTVVDAYLFVIEGWLAHFSIDINSWPNLAAHNQRVAARPAVQAALKAEGLL